MRSMSFGLGLRAELAAGRRNVAAHVLSHRHRHAGLVQNRREFPNLRLGRRSKRCVRRRVVRNQIHVVEMPAHQCALALARMRVSSLTPSSMTYSKKILRFVFAM